MGLTLIIYAIIAVTIAGTAATAFFLSKWLVRVWSLPNWIVPLAMLLGVFGGVYIAYFQIFSDLGERYVSERAAPRIEVLLPPGYEGFVYLFFDSSLPPVEVPSDKKITLTMAPKGAVLTGEYKGLEKNWMYVTPEFFHLKGNARTPAESFPDTSSGELSADKVGHRVIASGYYIGRREDYDRNIQAPDRRSWEIQERVYKSARKSH